MKKKIIGSNYSVDILTKDLYKADLLYKEGQSDEVFEIEIDDFTYKVNIALCFILAKYEIYFESKDKEFYFNLEIKQMYRQKVKKGEPKIVDIPVLTKPLEVNGYRLLIQYPKYEINEFGVVRNKKTKREIISVKSPDNGYYYTDLYDPSKNDRAKVRTHRLSALAWKHNDNYVIAYQVNHINGDKSENGSSNVEWSTGTENVLHALKTQLRPVNKYLIKDLVTGEVTGPLFYGQVKEKMGFFTNWLSRGTRSKPFKNRYEIIIEGSEWECSLEKTKKVINEHAYKGIQVKNVEKWLNGDSDWLSEFKSHRDAAETTNSHRGYISRLIREGKNNHVYNGYCFRPKSDEPWDDLLTYGKTSPKAIKIIYDDGRVSEHSTLASAAVEVEMTPMSLMRRTLNETTSGGFKTKLI